MGTQYLGQLGALVPLKAPARLRVDGARPGTLRTTLGGVRKAQTGQRVHRTWDVDLARLTRPEDAATLAGFVAGEFGTGPWVFVDVWAQVTNLCSPRGAALEVGALAGAVLGGAVDLGDGGWAGRHLLTTGAVDLPHVKGDPQYVPAIPGTPVTVSAWLFGGGTVTPVFRDAEGAVLAAAGPVVAAGGTGWERVAATATAPPTAASVQVRVDAERVARPAITWTWEPVAYHGGQGAPAVVLTAHTQDVGRAEPDPGRQYAAVRYTLEEVG